MADAGDTIASDWRLVGDDAADQRSTAGELIYAIGDVHGCYAPLRILLERISVDAEQHSGGRRPILILLGDYVDRGPRSSDVLDTVVWLKRQAPFEVHALKGNHEQGLLGFLDSPVASASWLKYGADETFASYGVDPLSSEAPDELLRVRDDLLERMPAAHLHLMQSLELIVEIGSYAFVHAGVRPGVPLDRQSDEDMMWIRRDFLDHEGPLPRTIVHGHSWKDARPQLKGNRIGIDTGVYSTDVLTALMLDGQTARYLQVEAS